MLEVSWQIGLTVAKRSCLKDTFLIALHPNDHLLEYSDLR